MPRRRFGGEHHRVGAFENRRRHVGDLGARRHRVRDHRFEHLRRNHDGLAGAPRRARELLLHARHLLERHFHAEVAARHHDGVGEVENVADPADRLRLFDLRHDGGAAAGDLLRVGDVLGALDE